MTGVSGSSAAATEQLSRVQIFQEMARRSCKIIWHADGRDDETSGCFFSRREGSVEVLTCFHEESWGLGKIEVIYGENRWEASVAVDVNRSLAADYDMVILTVENGSEEIPFFRLGAEREFPLAGEDVFFSGYPLGQNTSLTHRGYISGVREALASFTLDGPIVKGHSGGPVVKVHGVALELIGIISSQLVDMTRAFLTISRLDPNAEYRAYDDVSPSYAKGYSHADAIEQIARAVLNNVSTGIGRVSFVTRYVVITTPSYGPTSVSTAASSPRRASSAMSALSSISEADPWMQRNLGMSSSSSSSRAAPRQESVSEVPVKRGEHLPAGAKKGSKEWGWAHHVKTNKRPLFNLITGRADNKGKKNSRGKDNMSDDEYRLLMVYYALSHAVVSEEQINSSDLPQGAKVKLIEGLQQSASTEEESLSFNDLKKRIKKFFNKLQGTGKGKGKKKSQKKLSSEEIKAHKTTFMQAINNSGFPEEEREQLRELIELGVD
ncbi:hypothetical protein COB21_05635 [Candidatus Aerophobetes bacterium]|uniref:Serine protease n=1 Tax=Aerophobetes bacterium TaxID=2030807 RepID=A0A2A4WYB7_UNCAE|nr:MAG: hypothetical protein COB21_05635 [Candidatus Aerophobetes bacterium]